MEYQRLAYGFSYISLIAKSVCLAIQRNRYKLVQPNLAYRQYLRVTYQRLKIHSECCIHPVVTIQIPRMNAYGIPTILLRKESIGQAADNGFAWYVYQLMSMDVYGIRLHEVV